MPVNGIGGSPNDIMNVHADRNEPVRENRPEVREETEEERRRRIGPSFAVEQSDGIQKPYIYGVQKDDDGKLQVTFGQKIPSADDPDSDFLNRVHDAFNKSDLAPGSYSVWEDEDGKLRIEEYAENGEAVSAADTEDSRQLERLKEKVDKTDETEEEDDKDTDDGSSWMIMELIPDPEDPDNPYKAKRRIVAQGKGKTPGVNAK